MPDDRYDISEDPARFDLAAIHAYLTRSYWAAGVPLGIVARAIEHSLCFAVLHRADQVGFARVVTDRATFAYLCDVYVLEAHRGRGLAKRMLHAIIAHPDLQGLRRFVLATRDAHALYRRFGFTELQAPARFMEIVKPDVYVQGR